MESDQRLADFDNPLVRETAEKLVGSASTVHGKLKRLFHYVRDDIRFGFPRDGDLVMASTTIRLRMGQCNTKGTLLLALCKSVGIPARLHFSLIKKEIQRGLFTGLCYQLMPPLLSHCWIEVEVSRKWWKVDSYINDKAYFLAAKSELRNKKWETGYSVSCPGGECSCDLDFDQGAFVQMGAVVDDHGVWDDPGDYYASNLYQNRPNHVKLALYQLLIEKVNRKIESMRKDMKNDRDFGLSERSRSPF